LFRLQRFGIEAPQVLAVGERTVGAEVEAFLLTRQPAGVQPLTDWLLEQLGRQLSPRELRLRWAAFRGTGMLLARLHEAGCFFQGMPTEIAVRVSAEEAPRVVIDDAAGLCIRRRFRRLHARRDLTRLCRHLAVCGCSRTEQRRILDGYPVGERMG